SYLSDIKDTFFRRLCLGSGVVLTVWFLGGVESLLGFFFFALTSSSKAPGWQPPKEVARSYSGAATRRHHPAATETTATFAPWICKGAMFRCSARCCENGTASMQQVQQCIERCHAPLAQAQAIVTGELERFQVRNNMAAVGSGVHGTRLGVPEPADTPIPPVRPRPRCRTA
uniref:Protein FAM136A n=1 Tax=Anser brachyrhynchus TaxID=132585 RepID=A0A8B9CQN7_9AVES